MRVLRQKYPDSINFSAIVNTVLMNHFVLGAAVPPMPLYNTEQVIKGTDAVTEADEAFSDLFLEGDDW